MHMFVFTIVFFGKRKNNIHKTFHILKMKAHFQKGHILKMKAHSETHFMDDPYSFKENEGKRPEEVHFNLEGKHLNYLFYPLQIVRNCDGYSGRP